VAIPLVIYAMSASQALPVLAALRHGTRLPASRRWIILAMVIGLAMDGIGLSYALRGQNNHWLGYLAAPLEVAAILFGLAAWQSGLLARRVVRALAAGFALFVALLALIETGTAPSLVRGPVESILIVSACAFTLVRLSRQEQGSLFQRAWFWICTGLIIRYGALAALQPLGRALMDDSAATVLTLLKVRAVVHIVAHAIIARGIWCPILPQPSSGLSSPASWPSSSSSGPSARPW
jgi:hypothetical protein